MALIVINHKRASVRPPAGDQTEVGNGCPEAFDESTPPEFWPGPLDCAALIEDGRAESRRPRRFRTNRDA